MGEYILIIQRNIVYNTVRVYKQCSSVIVVVEVSLLLFFFYFVIKIIFHFGLRLRNYSVFVGLLFFFKFILSFYWLIYDQSD